MLGAQVLYRLYVPRIYFLYVAQIAIGWDQIGSKLRSRLAMMRQDGHFGINLVVDGANLVASSLKISHDGT